MQKLVWQNSNGDEIDLTSGNYGITNWEGFANVSLDIQTQKVPFNDGSVYLDSLLNERELNVTLAIQDNNNLETRYRLRRELIHILNPKLGEGHLIYTNDFTSKRIKCIPQVPLFENHNSNDSGTPKASLSWTANEPYWEDLEETILEIINGQRVVINNEGDVNCSVKLNIYNSGTSVSAQNETDSKALKVENLSQNSNVYINTNVGEKSVEVESGTETKNVLNNNCDYCCFVDSLNEEMYINNSVIIVGDKCYTPNQMYYKLYGFAENDDIYVFIAKDRYNKSYIYHSVGKSFTNLEMSLQNQNEIFGVKYIAEKGIFIAYGRVMWKSSDGVNWENISVNDVYYDVCYNPKNSTYYLAKIGGDIDKTTDLITFTTISLQGKSVHQILWDAKDEVLICAGTTILYSDDGITFSIGFDERSVNADYAIDCGTYFLIYGGPVASPSVFYSYNGKQWNEIPIEHIRNVKYGLFNKVKGSAVILNQNTDTVTINTLPYITETFASGTINSVFSKNDKLYVFFQNGKICEIDSSNNTRNTVTLDEPIKEICYDVYKKMYVGICGNKKIAISADLKNWMYRVMPENVELNSITYDDIEHYIIIGTSAGFYYSVDLDNWEYYYDLINVSKVFYSKIYKYCIAVGKENGNCVIRKNYHIHDYSDWEVCSIAYQAPSELTDITEDNEYIYVSGRYGTSGGTGSGYILYTSDLYNFKYLMDPEYTEIYIAFNAVKNTKYGIITGGYAYETNSNIVITNDKFENVTRKDFSLAEINGIVIRENNGNVIIYGADFIYEITPTSKENAIKKLSSDSDMSFSLQIGENNILLQSNNYNTTGQLLYRQKYIGV